jgi:transposase-like protein
LLFVIDGSKALRKAIRDVFGGLALVQRCQVHSVPSRGTRFVGGRVA